MLRKVTALLTLFFIYERVNAQNPVEILNNWSEKSPIEKVYLHTDRENYIAGETVWFKAYLAADFYPDTISTTLYVELINESSKTLDRKIVPVYWGAARGQLDIPDSITSGNYIIRAYSATMLNHGTDFIFNRNVFIYGKKNNSAAAVSIPKILRLEFFPEGGNLVNGFVNAVAFKATNENGLPVFINGSLYHENNQQLSAFNSYHDGMGMVEFTPLANQKYYLLIDGHPLTKYYLPEATDKGIGLAIVTNPKQLLFEIQQSFTDPSFQAAYIIGQMQHRVIFRQELSAGKPMISGQVNTQKLNSGILQVTVFNREGVPLAERLCFIDNKEYIQQAELVTDTVSFVAKGRNRYSLRIKDTVQGNFSIAITDPAYDILPFREENIFSSLLLTSDIKGYVHNPSWYFTGNSDSTRRAIDLVMMTNGWRRFKWNDLIKNKVPENKYKDLCYIAIAGKVNLLDSKKPFAEKQLLITITNADSVSTFHLTNTDAQGNFRLDSMFFWGNPRLLFSDSRGKKSQLIQVKLTGDSLGRTFPFQVNDKITSQINDSSLSVRQAALALDYDAIQKASGIMLEGITIKGKRKKTPTEEVEEKYTSGLFTGQATRVVDLVNTDEQLPQRNIFEYIQSRVPGITVTTSLDDPMNYVLYFRGGNTMSLQGPIPMKLFLNEMRATAVDIAAFRASDIAMIKVYSSFVGAENNGAGGVLSVYTKKGEDTRGNDLSAVYESNYRGYSVSKEFYSPDYKVNQTEKFKTDNRITLQWLPDVFINDVDPVLPFAFYNTDRTKQFKIVIEGTTTNGKLLMIEKIITPKAGF